MRWYCVLITGRCAAECLSEEDLVCALYRLLLYKVMLFWVGSRRCRWSQCVFRVVAVYSVLYIWLLLCMVTLTSVLRITLLTYHVLFFACGRKAASELR